MSQSEFQISDPNDLSSEERYKKPKKQMVYEEGVQQGPWNDQQHKKYLMFLNYHLANKGSKGKKNGQKKKKLFKLMSQFIGTRNLLQCRSHHQKLQLKYPTMKTLVEKEKKKYLIDGFNELYRDQYLRIKEIYDEGKTSDTSINGSSERQPISDKKQVGCQTFDDGSPTNGLLFPEYNCNSNSIQLLMMNGLNGSPLFFVMPQTFDQGLWQTQ